MSKIALTSSMRSNLQSLKAISTQMDKTQERLSTGKDVNSALDNASSYYQARALTNRASDLDSLLDSMGQGIQTISATSEGIEKGLAFLEQAKAVAEQALSQSGTKAGIEGSGGVAPDLTTKDVAEYEAVGYSVITADMSVADINNLINAPGAKVVLAEDISLNDSLMIGASDVIIEGNGHKLTINDGSGQGMGIMIQATGTKISNLELDFTSGTPYVSAAVVVGGATTVVDISAVKINNEDASGYGILAMQGGQVNIDTLGGINADIKAVGTSLASADDASLYAGEAYTKAIVNQIGADGLAATAANQFYVGSKTGDFGQGKWYLPAIGELMEMYGTDTSAITGDFFGTTGADGDNMQLINDALGTLAAKDSSVASRMSGYYWSSSEYFSNLSWELTTSNGGRPNGNEDSNTHVRCFQLLKNCFNPSALSGTGGGGGSGAAPQIGDVMYSDKTWGSADDYDGSKTAVGIVCAVNNDGSVKIVNLKDLTFSNNNSTGNFNADNPYGGSTPYTYWSTGDDMYTNINAIPDFTGYIGVDGGINVGGVTGGATGGSGSAGSAGGGSGDVFGEVFAVDDVYGKQYNLILSEYDKMIKDTSYQGINLLNEGRLVVTLNEARSHKIVVDGVDAKYEAIGLETVDWNNTGDVEKALSELTVAINKLRNYSTMFGSQYQLIQTRQNFTDALIDVLETGADNLVLADMNEESANYLALQTRQQLATNSLSLASQSAQSILSLF